MLYYYRMKKISLLICCLFLTAAITLTITGCQTIKDIPEDLTAPQILQRAQSYYDAADYKNAEACYKATIDRYGSDTNTYIEAKYELAHFYLKTKNYEKARSALEEIIEIYDYAAAGDLPPAYKKLAQLDMEKLPNR